MPMPTYPGASSVPTCLRHECNIRRSSDTLPGIAGARSRCSPTSLRRLAHLAGIVELDELKVAVANRAGGTASEKKCGEARVMPVESIAPKPAGAFEEWHR